MNLWLILFFLLIGFSIGYLKLFSKRFYKFNDVITKVGLVLILLTMGAKIGIDDRILGRFGEIGFQAILLALGSIVGSVVLVKLFSYKFYPIIQTSGENNKQLVDTQGVSRFMTLIIFFSVVTGIISGIYFLPASFLNLLDKVTTYALAILLLGIGVDIGQNKEVLKGVKKSGWQIIAIPIMVVIGSLTGSVFVGLFLGLSGNEAAAVGAGFGWYSLSGILLAKIYSVELGSLAFLTNVLRELFSILLLPIVIKYFGKVTGIAPGGATTMDVTLPVIKEAGGDEIVIPAFVNGLVLSALVPILVPFFINL